MQVSIQSTQLYIQFVHKLDNMPHLLDCYDKIKTQTDSHNDF